jgi:hypothetical protein
MSFASAERAYLTPPDDHSCTRCEDDDAMDHDDCIEAAADERDDAMRDRADAYREGEDW